MSNTTHTPWTLGTHDPRVVYSTHGDEVVTVHGHYDDAVPVAHLIAAAPDLLAALEKLVAAVIHDHGEIAFPGCPICDASNRAKAAIAAAKGEK